MEAGAPTIPDRSGVLPELRALAGRYPARVALAIVALIALALDRDGGAARHRADEPERPLLRRDLRPRRRRPDAGLRNPEARQLRPRRLPHLRGVHGVPGERHLGAPVRAGRARVGGRDGGARARSSSASCGGRCAPGGRDAAAHADVDRARPRPSQHDPVHLGLGVAESRRRRLLDGLVPRSSHRPHRADRDDHRHRRAVGRRTPVALLVPRQADASPLRQRGPGRDLRHRHRPRDHLHVDPRRAASRASRAP